MFKKQILLIVLLTSSIVCSFSHILNSHQASWVIPLVSQVFLISSISIVFLKYFLKLFKNKESKDKELELVSRHIVFLDAIPESVIVLSKKTQKCCFANKAFYAMTNLKQNEVLGSQVNDFLSVESNIKDNNVEQILKIKDNDEISVIISWESLTIENNDYEIMHITDVSIITCLQKNIAHTDAKKILAFYKAKAAIVIVDALSKKIVQANKTACDILKQDSESLIGSHCQGLICNLSEKECNAIQSSQCPFQQEEEMKVDKESSITVLRGSSKMKIGQHEYIIDTFIDITDKKKTDEAIQKNKIRKLTETIVYGIAHEFNNINAVINGVIDTLLMPDCNFHLQESTRDQLDIIHQMTERATEIIENLLIFGPNHKQHTQNINVYSSIKEIIKTQSDVDFCLDIPKDLYINFDINDFNKLIKNIIINSVHSMIESENKSIDININQKDHSISIEINDYGCGINAKDLDKVFDPFFSTKGVYAHSGSLYSEITGKGLGLSICQIITERNYGGKINIESEENKGTKVTIDIPCDTE
jgi:PAS domain S-box-containing protein